MGELFAGIGGFSLGFRRAGFDVKWQVEIDPYCRKVLAKNFPEAERFDDVRTVGAANLQPVDVICGGFPCQDISYAGLGAGIDGERSGLWREYARIIGELRPRYAVVENVPALLTRGLGRVLGDLAEIGYDAEWHSISVADFGGEQGRERVWLVAYPRRARLHERRRHFNAGAEMQHVGGTLRNELQGQPGIPGTVLDRRGWRARIVGWATESGVARVAHGVSNRPHRIKALGNAVVPQIPEWIANRILQAEASA